MTTYRIRYGMLALLFAMACGGTEEELSTDTTRIVNEGGLQFVFDLVTPEAHQEMMEAMGHGEDGMQGMPGDHMGGTNHPMQGMAGDHMDGTDHPMQDQMMDESHRFIVLTVIDVEADGSTLTTGDVSFAITGPDGNPMETSGHAMSGMGMHHFAAHFEPSAAGNYSVRATLTREGKDPVNATAVFSL